MKSKPLWKNIGKQQEDSSGQSSVDQNKNKKGFEINFSDQILSPTSYNRQTALKNVYSIPQNYCLSQQSRHERTPMILTTQDIDGNKYEEDQVLQAISLQSQKQKVVDLQYILGNFKEIQGKNRQYIRKEEIPVIQYKELKNLSQNKVKNSKIIDLSRKLQVLKKYFLEYVFFVNQTINQMNFSIDELRYKIEEAISYQFKKQKLAFEQKIQSVNERFYKNQIENLKQCLKRQRNKSIQYKLQIQSELKKIKSADETIQEKKNELQFQKIKIEQSYVMKIKNLEQELSDYKNERNSALTKINKYKQDLLIFGNNFQRLTQQNNTFRKNIKQLRDKFQDQQALVRKTQNKIALQKQKLQNQSAHNSKQMTRLKQQCSRLCDLLKESETQLKQCDQMFASILKKNKDLEQHNTKLTSKLRDADLIYYKKLQVFDKMLLEVENSLQEVNKNHQNQKQQFLYQLQKSEKERQRISLKQIQLKSREYQIEQLKKQVEQQFYILEKKEEGMKAEYKTAIQLQHASKDKWYQRYYNFFPEKEEKRYQVNSPTRDTNHYPNTVRYQTRKEFMHSPVRQNLSPPCKQLYRAKSQKNFTIYTGCEGMKRPKVKFSQIQKPQSFKDYNITSRIDILRKQLTKQLNQMTQH